MTDMFLGWAMIYAVTPPKLRPLVRDLMVLDFVLMCDERSKQHGI
jgi:hypothetical protein